MELNQQARLRIIGARGCLMKMLLASSDFPMLQSVAERLVAAGIPIAVCRNSDISSSPEVWIQRDSDFSQARKLLAEGFAALAAAPAVKRPAAAPATKGIDRPCAGLVRSEGPAMTGTLWGTALRWVSLQAVRE